MKKAESEMASSFPEVANEFVQKTEVLALRRLQEHVVALETQLQRAQQRAHGTGKRNKEGFRNRGCGCRTCVARVGRIQQKLELAREKYQTELSRLNPYQHMEPNPPGTLLLTATT